ncbi:alpha/beta fold hydrolase [Flavobacterium sp. Sd200]|uniref:alpha/beta hydrolase n=1 Tax=Flavobacterium sp. Sd200 TaxID=2692211 RepID=UPI0013702B24|nr:alpha/beta hydrolase [Flavobacterium sp. Sd200]MXN89842.1 alpha/beta fold hydrolase [Flavobacterium sp. Sd200]
MKTNEFNVTRSFKTVSKAFILLLTVSAFGGCSDNDNEDVSAKSPIVLVHGAWQGAYVWDQTESDLKAAGYRVSVVKLPAHGDDTTPAFQVSLKAYVDVVKAAVNNYNEPVILIGHSLGGAVITQAASELPTKIKKLVYVAGFIPKSGKSVLDYANIDTTSLLGPAIRLSEDQTVANIDNPAVNLSNIFCQDGTDAQKQYLVGRYKGEPTIPLGTPLNYNAADYSAAGTKYYIHTTADKTITYGFQQQMATDAGITNAYTINSGHSPFISKSSELTSLLKKIAKK